VNRAQLLLALAALTVAGATACAKTPPATPVVTALAMPTPPARLLIPIDLPAYVEPTPEPVAEVVPPPAPVRSAATSRPTEKPPAPVVPPPDAPAPPVLQTTNAAPSALEQRVRTLLASAEERLKTVNFLELGASGRAHHSQARDFIRMANDNLRIRNYVYAEQLAVKANTVAGLLMPKG
jgi:hypothetical protein